MSQEREEAGVRVFCEKCRRMVDVPWDGPSPDLSDSATVDRLSALIPPRLLAECPNHVAPSGPMETPQ